MTTRTTSHESAPAPIEDMGRATVSGRVHVWHGGSLWIGRGHGRTQWHAHHALQIVLALDGICRFRTREDGPWADFHAALVLSNRRLFVEPETAQGRTLSRLFAASDISALCEAQRLAMAALLFPAYQRGAPAQEMAALGHQALALLSATEPCTPGLDPRIEQALGFIQMRLHGPLSLNDVARAVHLSPERLRHLFVAATGTTFRAYVLWARINAAIAAAMDGASWTDAAHLAGFADSAHLSRTFKRMFGIAPMTIGRG
jgi:AraC-like DNA-binding protein